MLSVGWHCDDGGIRFGEPFFWIVLCLPLSEYLVWKKEARIMPIQRGFVKQFATPLCEDVMFRN